MIPASLPASLVLVGAGRMGGALLDGWLALGLAPAAVTIVEPNPSPDLRQRVTERRIALRSVADGVAAPDVLVLAVKPQMLDAAAASLGAVASPATLVLSIMAGKSIADIAARLPQAGGIVRAMPNTPAAIGRGISGAFANDSTSCAQRATAQALLEAIGQVEWLPDEAAIDAVTAVSGSGPAYVFYLVECLAEAGAQAGLAPDLAMRLARATVEGSGELLARSPGEPASALRQAVTSPGGTTAEALAVLSAADGLPPLMARAVAAAQRRAAELAG